MTPWLLFGAGGKGVGARTLELANAPALNQQVYSLIEPDLKPA